MKHSPRPRKSTELSDSIRRRLNLYALGTAAAGVAAMALTPAAEAKIVYTPAHPPLVGTIIDFNHAAREISRSFQPWMPLRRWVC